LQQGSRSYPLGFHNEGKTNVAENCGITKVKVLEYMRVLTRGKRANKWADGPIGGASQPHMSSPCGGFSHGGF